MKTTIFTFALFNLIFPLHTMHDAISDTDHKKLLHRKLFEEFLTQKKTAATDRKLFDDGSESYSTSKSLATNLLMEYTTKTKPHVGKYFKETIRIVLITSQKDFLNRKLNEIGYIIYQVFKKECSVIILNVQEKYRRQGYGTILLNEVEQEIKKAGCIKITLPTTTPEGRLFYEKKGFSSASKHDSSMEKNLDI